MTTCKKGIDISINFGLLIITLRKGKNTKKSLCKQANFLCNKLPSTTIRNGIQSIQNWKLFSQERKLVIKIN
jgi:hypothetical protein